MPNHTPLATLMANLRCCARQVTVSYLAQHNVLDGINRALAELCGSNELPEDPFALLADSLEEFQKDFDEPPPTVPQLESSEAFAVGEAVADRWGYLMRFRDDAEAAAVVEQSLPSVVLREASISQQSQTATSSPPTRPRPAREQGEWTEQPSDSASAIEQGVGGEAVAMRETALASGVSPTKDASVVAREAPSSDPEPAAPDVVRTSQGGSPAGAASSATPRAVAEPTKESRASPDGSPKESAPLLAWGLAWGDGSPLGQGLAVAGVAALVILVGGAAATAFRGRKAT